jgi:large subunit ribosomal protein L13
MSTTIAKAADVQHGWFVIDATDQTLGRLATRIATVLRGRHKPQFTSHVDCGDFVIVTNVEKVKLTGNKVTQKFYFSYSGHPGGMRRQSAGELLNTHPDRVLEQAVRGMLPKNRLSRQVIKKLKIYSGPNHPHVAQQPQPFPAFV